MMPKSYTCLSVQDFQLGRHRLLPIRDDDKYAIMQWRNDQIDVLRQARPLTNEDQEQYFKNVVTPLFHAEKPEQILFAFLEDGLLIGYGGLVHIDWDSRNAEISFITETDRSNDAKLFMHDWKVYLTCLKGLIHKNSLLTKIYTYAYDMRPILYDALRQSFFMEEARLKDHVVIRGQYRDVLIHSYFLDRLIFRLANSTDIMLYFEWANDHAVRVNSLNEAEITLEHHRTWFSNKLASPETTMLVAMKDNAPVGQIRFDLVYDGNYEIDFSIASKRRGKNIGSLLLARGIEEFFKINPAVKKVVGRVKSGNVASLRSFEKVGFAQIHNAGSKDMLVYYLDNPFL